MWSRGYSVGMGLLLAVLGGTSVTWAYEVGDILKAGTISGKVTFEGVVPPPKHFPVEKDPEVCGLERTVNEVVAQNGLLQGAVVVLEGVEKGKPFAALRYKGNPPGEGEFRYGGGSHLALEVLAKGCNFGPFTGVLTPDEPVRFLNQDRIKHILHSVSSKDDRGLILRTIHQRELRTDMVVERTFDARKLKTNRVVGIHCNRHDFMQTWLYVVTTPYFSISDHEGTFTIDQVPAGDYTLIAWHPVLGVQRQDVQVDKGGHIEVSFGFTQE